MIPRFLDNALGFNIDRVAVLLRRELIRVLAEYGLTPEQWQILATLWHSECSLTQVQICSMILRDKPSVSKMIRKLEKKGWIQKRKSSSDARQTLIELTEIGVQFRTIIPEKVSAKMSKKFDALNSDEITLLMKLVKKLRGFLEDQPLLKQSKQTEVQ